MAEFEIKDEDFASLEGQVVIVTGCASGMGLVTAKLLLHIGASVVGGDTSVTSWDELSALFREAKTLHGRIDHVFANAGIGSRTNYLDEQFDDSGNLLEPDHRVLEVNLRGVINTCTLAFHYMRPQITGGSIVITASASSFQRLRVVDYTTAKHGVLGFVRGMVPNFATKNLPIRINAIAPSWTVTGMIPAGFAEAGGKPSQPAEVPARSVAWLMADTSRQGEVIYSENGKFKEIESILLKGAEEVLGDGISDDTVMARILEHAAKSGSQEGSIGLT